MASQGSSFLIISIFSVHLEVTSLGGSEEEAGGAGILKGRYEILT